MSRIKPAFLLNGTKNQAFSTKLPHPHTTLQPHTEIGADWATKLHEQAQYNKRLRFSSGLNNPLNPRNQQWYKQLLQEDNSSKEPSR